jgi:hypothetical protein
MESVVYERTCWATTLPSSWTTETRHCGPIDRQYLHDFLKRGTARVRSLPPPSQMPLRSGSFVLTIKWKTYRNSPRSFFPANTFKLLSRRRFLAGLLCGRDLLRSCLLRLLDRNEFTGHFVPLRPGGCTTHCRLSLTALLHSTLASIVAGWLVRCHLCP